MQNEPNLALWQEAQEWIVRHNLPLTELVLKGGGETFVTFSFNSPRSLGVLRSKYETPNQPLRFVAKRHACFYASPELAQVDDYLRIDEQIFALLSALQSLQNCPPNALEFLQQAQYALGESRLAFVQYMLKADELSKEI